jgi:hypothetical protein
MQKGQAILRHHSGLSAFCCHLANLSSRQPTGRTAALIRFKNNIFLNIKLNFVVKNSGGRN